MRSGSKGLTMKREMCRAGMAQVTHWTRVGLGTECQDPAKIDAVQNCPIPNTRSKVLCFMGPVGFYRGFEPSLSATAAPLADLPGKGTPDRATGPGCASTPDQLNKALVGEP